MAMNDYHFELYPAERNHAMEQVYNMLVKPYINDRLIRVKVLHKKAKKKKSKRNLIPAEA
jgi:hypothetical protein